MTVERTKSEIDEQIDRASEIIGSVGSKYPGMSYEEGIQDALVWALDLNADAPLEEEDIA